MIDVVGKRDLGRRFWVVRSDRTVATEDDGKGEKQRSA